MRSERTDTAARLSLIFYLSEKNLLELANDEIRSLQNDLPENEYVKNIDE